MEEEERCVDVFAVINNIPASYHSSDLRNYFSQFIERRGFKCFHFKNRSESRKLKPDSTDTTVAVHSNQENCENEDGIIMSNASATNTICTTKCCVIKLDSVDKLKELQGLYHNRNWLDRNSERIKGLCLIRKIADTEDDHSRKYQTRGEKKTASKYKEEFSQKDLENLPELHPPTNIMPNGNVGTPTAVFLTLIQQCKLPPSVIKKLGITFPKIRSKRRYGNVPFEYLNSTEFEVDKAIESKIDRGNILQESGDEQFRKEVKDNHTIDDNSDKSESDVDDCEEWERHEALHDDPINVERNKERLFEEEIELKWEKGGSGLVFYTDAQFWKEQEGDFDEQTADDWDVDMSVYYEENGGDKDARDYVTMRQEQRRRNGEEDTDLRTAGFLRNKITKKSKITVEDLDSKIGAFELFTKGIGRKVLEKQGWKDGEGVGLSTKGISDALDNEGQSAADKRGLGYHGEKLDRSNECGPSGRKIRKVQKNDKPVTISTIYDDPKVTDPQEHLLRRNHHHHIKYRHGINFQKATQPD